MTHERILLADDDAMILDVLRYQLEKEGYQVLTAEDGQQALDLAQTGQPDLVLLDVMMPKLQGWEVCRELRRTSEVPILMLTARGEEMDRVLGLELGADDYIVKPFSFRELLARIHAALRRAAYSQQSVTAPEPERSRPSSATCSSTGGDTRSPAAASRSRSRRVSTICWWPCWTQTAPWLLVTTSWIKSGAKSGWALPERWTYTSGGCAERSRPILPIPS